MSSEQQQLDPDLIEQTKQQIRGLVSEIAQLAKSDATEVDFYDAMLNRVISAMAAVGGAVWTLQDSGRLECVYQSNIRATGLADDPDGQIRHGNLLRRVLESGEGMLAGPHSGGVENDEPGNPTDYLLVLGPLKSDKETAGVVEIFQRPTTVPKTQKGYLRFLQTVCDLAGEFLKTRRLRHFVDRQALWSQLEQFTRATHASLEPRQTAYTIANEGRRLIECDRLTVAVRKGRKCHIEAVSGQDTFDKRSNTVTLLAYLASAVAATGDAIWYFGDTSDMPPQVEEAVQDYVDESHTKTLAVLPLKRQSEASEDQDRPEPPEVIGALIVEQIEENRFREGALQRIEVVQEHSETALANSLEHNNLFLMPLWRQLGRAKWVVQARTLPKTIAICTAILLSITALAVVPADFDLRGEGQLVAQVQRDVWVPVTGDVEVLEVFVRNGQFVKEGEQIVQLNSRDLDAQLQGINGEISAQRSQIDALSSQVNRSDGSIRDFEKRKLQGEIQVAMAKLKSLLNQAEIYNEKLQQLKVTAPISGVVISWNIEDELKQRPVNRGEKLMTIADPSGPLELEIEMPENRMGHVLAADQRRLERISQLEKERSTATGERRRELESELANLEKGLEVTYILMTHPDREFVGRAREIAKIAEVQKEEDGNTVLIRVALGRDEMNGMELQLGTTATAKVACGRRAIGYVWFHDLIAFFQKLWFRVPSPGITYNANSHGA